MKKDEPPVMAGTGLSSSGSSFPLPRAENGFVGRLVSIFGSLGPDRQILVHYIFDLGTRDYREILLPAEGPVRSITSDVPAASWYERELHDQYGVEFIGHPDPRPLIFHDNWPPSVHPMVDSTENVPWVMEEYPFLKVQGEGIAEVPVGPVHAGIIEPGHFRFSVVGDTILHLELRHFYTHKGTEKLFAGSLVSDGAMIAESVSGDNCFANAVAYCQAVESTYATEVSPRAAVIRMIGLEFERLVSHISDVGGLCADVGFGVGTALAVRLKETLLQASTALCGTRYWRGIVVPGGLRCDLDSSHVREFAKIVSLTAHQFAGLANIILETPSIQNRFETAGIVRTKVARDLALVGPVARASGVDVDVRRDHPYGYYGQVKLDVPVTHYGDVMARAKIRIEEAAVSARLIQEAASALPDSSAQIPLDAPEEFRGFSAVESPRGELYYWLEGRSGRLTRCYIKSPSFQNWPAMPFAAADNIIADFPLINKSFNLSYSGCDR
jgi:Ni,Fe-hydrogenase III large subunit